MLSEDAHAAFGMAPPDPTIKQTTEILGLSRRKVYRLVEGGYLISYLLGGRRRVSLASIRFYIDQCRNAGPQFGPPLTGKRARGRPKKPRPGQEPSAASAG
jgi:excisionase family DNA binding protein